MTITVKVRIREQILTFFFVCVCGGEYVSLRFFYSCEYVALFCSLSFACTQLSHFPYKYLLLFSK